MDGWTDVTSIEKFPQTMEFFVLVAQTFIYLRQCMACEILVSQPGNRPTPPVVEVQSAFHWVIKEVPAFIYFVIIIVL